MYNLMVKGGCALNISITAGYFMKNSASSDRMELVFKTLAENGINNFDYLTNIDCDDYLDVARRCREIADKTGTVIHQSHCPFNRYRKDITYADVLPRSLRSVEAAAVLGARCLVVHADENRYDEDKTFNPDKIMVQMYDYISRITEKAEPYGIKVCIENLFEEGRYPDMERSRFTSDINELLGLVEKFDEKNVGICWDFGHARVGFGEKCMDMLKLALPRVCCTHVHDNNNKDEHQLPFAGKNDWKTLMPLLKESGYNGNINFEIEHGNIPDELMVDYIRYCKKVGDYLIKLQG